ncbi:G-type lectin S-receptor-like serine/threonine-protein kinase SD1-13 [Henckelia pumila]|uniref:G-type lectin S-receptor-like serine/threonine-protein kinase SD1-13 n=1 Tax=Henckelia pumila TaxID=405737 RepID=UPI003C6E5666
MYNIPVLTVIWVANRENPLNDANGTLLILGDGNLVILNGQKQMLWSSNVSKSIPNSSARLLDTGNLVLQDNSNELNASGALHHKLWDDKTGDWTLTWSSMSSECDVYAECGLFGSCFEPKNDREWSGGNWTSGCLRRAPLKCGKNSSVGEMGKEDGFFMLETVKVPDRLSWLPSLEPECRSKCLHNCSCLAYAYHDGIGCNIKKKGRRAIIAECSCSTSSSFDN